MGIRAARGDREYDKFTTGSSGETAVRTTIDSPINVELTASDIQIGAVEIKDATGSSRAVVNSSGALSVVDVVANSLVPSVFDYINLSYSGSDVTQVFYKSGGSGGSTVSTLDLGYDTAGNVTSVTKS